MNCAEARRRTPCSPRKLRSVRSEVKRQTILRRPRDQLGSKRRKKQFDAPKTETYCAHPFPHRETISMKTFSAKANEVQRQWWVIDAADQILGRVAVKAATLLRGKEKAIFTPHVDTGDFVVVINASKVRVTGKKEVAKTYMSFSGYVGGHKSETFRDRRARHPELLVEKAIWGMVPHNRLGRRM